MRPAPFLIRGPSSIVATLNNARHGARSALRAWSCALRTLGFGVPLWIEPARPRPLSPMLAEFAEYRLRHGGVTPSTVPSDVRYVSEFITFLRKRGRRADAVRVLDVDAFVAACCLRMTRKTVAGVCSSLRAFLRFRLAVGQLRHDLAPSVVGPRIRSADRPPRAMAWKDVQRLVRAIDVRGPLGRRDFAMLLTMATYGMGAGEVLGLRVDDIDWKARTVRVRRPKTETAFMLPLLDPIARAFADYLRHERPAHAVAREIFVSHKMPHLRLTAASAIRHRLVKHASAAGLTPTFLGSHVLRHSHACRQNRDRGASQGAERHPRAPSPLVDVGVRSRGRGSTSWPRVAGADMSRFVSHLGPELEAFLAFKRTMGHPYVRAEFTLRSFDGFVLSYARRHRPFLLDEALLAWLASKRKDRKPVTVTVDLGAVRQFCLHRRRHDPAAFVPGRVWAPQSTKSDFLPFVFTDAQVRELLRRATSLDRPPVRGVVFRALLLVLYCTGVRFGEAVRLRMKDVDTDGCLLFIAESKGRSRWVPFERSLRRELVKYTVARRAVVAAGPNDPFFIEANGRRLRTKAASDAVRALLRAAGLKPPVGRVGPRPYDFRHTFAVHRLTRWYRAGVDINARLPWLSAYMGHNDILGTEIYLTATPELIAIASRRFERHLARRSNDSP